MEKTEFASQSPGARLDLLDWLKGCAIIAVVLDHELIVPQAFVVWSVNVFVLVTAAVYSRAGHVFSFKKLLSKCLHVFYVIACGVLCCDLLFSLVVPQYNRAVLSVLLDPYSFFVKNHYLGNIWYVTLHLQILFVFYFFMKARPFFRPRTVLIAAAIIAAVSYAVSHFLLHRFNTIFVGSWLIYITAGFYGLLPLLKVIEKHPHPRFLWLLGSLLCLTALYALYPLEFPLAFTNRNRCSALMLPLYFFLIIFLAELFWILGSSPAGRWVKAAGNLLGHHTLAIYLTHQAFAFAVRQMIPSPWLAAFLSVGAGILFGLLTEGILSRLKTFASSAAAVLRPRFGIKFQEIK